MHFKWSKYASTVMLSFLIGCQSNADCGCEDGHLHDLMLSEQMVNENDSIKVKKEKSEIEKRLIEAGLVDIQSVDSSIRIDVKYATTDNFVGKVLYQDYDKVYLQEEVAERLAKVQKTLKNKDSNLTLLVFDGARPRFVQQQMWDSLDSIPVSERGKFVSNPKNGGLHNFGCAVDLTIQNETTGEWLDMGAGYDDIRKIAYPKLEQHYLSIGELTKEQIDNRKFLRDVMKTGNFWVLETEWWHFNAYSRDKAKQLYKIIE